MKFPLIDAMRFASLVASIVFLGLLALAVSSSLRFNHYNQYTVPLLNKQIGAYSFSLVIWAVYLIVLQLKLKGLALPYFLFSFVIWDGQSVFTDPGQYNPDKIVWWVPYSITHPLYLSLLGLTVILMGLYHKRYQISLNVCLFILFLVLPNFFLWALFITQQFTNIPEIVNSITLLTLLYSGVKLR